MNFEPKRKSKFLLLDIIKKISEGLTPFDIYKSYGWKRQRFNYHLKKLEKANLIKLKLKSHINLYELTEEGKSFYAECIRQLPSSNLELHNISWIYDLKSVGNLKPESVSEKGISKLTFRNVTVMWSKEHIWFDIVKMFGNDAFKLQDDSANLRDKVAEQLRSVGFEFDNPRLMRKGHYGIIDPVITKTAKSVELRSNDYKIDESEGYGELEFFEPQSVDNYLKAMVGMGKMLPLIVEQQKEFAENLKLHLSVLQELRDSIKELRESLKK